MKQLATLVFAGLVLGAVLMGCDSKPDARSAEERQMADGRRDSPDPIAPPGPPDSSMISDDTAPPADDE